MKVTVVAALVIVACAFAGTTAEAAAPKKGVRPYSYKVDVNVPKEEVHNLDLARQYYSYARPTACHRHTLHLSYRPLPPGRSAEFSGGPVCRITVNADVGWWMTSWMNCQVLVHEYGHAIGLGHSEDPNDIMFSPAVSPDRPLGSASLRWGEGIYQQGLIPLCA